MSVTRDIVRVGGVQASTLQFLEMATAQKEQVEMQFAYPEGLDVLTKSRKFHPRFMDVAMELFEASHRMSVVVRTDYRVSDIAEFLGRWLVAHLLGHVKGCCYDDFVATSKDKILAVVPGVMAGRVSETEEGQLYAAIQFDSRTVEEIEAQIKEYQSKSKQRFHYQLFARLPHFCVAEEEAFRGALASARMKWKDCVWTLRRSCRILASSSRTSPRATYFAKTTSRMRY